MGTEASHSRTDGYMRAFRVEKGSTEAQLQQVQIPSLGSNDVLIRVRTAILAPDVFRLVKAGQLYQSPTTLGHKVAGIVAAVGDNVSHLHPGQRVRLDPNLSCGNCTFCRTDRDQMCAECGVMGIFSLERFRNWEEYHPGGLADYVRAPAAQVDLLPDNLSFEVGAMVHDLANAVRALGNAQLRIGSTLLITAATGAMGACCIKIAPFFGVTRLILVSRNAERLGRSSQLGNIPCDCVATDDLREDWTTNQGLGKRICELVPDGVDAIIDFSADGVDLWQVLDGLKIGGTFIPMGGNPSTLPYSARTLGLKSWRVIGSRNHSKSDSRSVLQLLSGGRMDVNDLVSHGFSLQDVEKAAAHLQERHHQSWMTVIKP